MKIQILSDLHLELYDREIQKDFFPSINPSVDVVVLAGDIDHGDYSLINAEKISQKFGCYVVWVPGNHEFYGLDYNKQMQRYKKTKENNNLTVGMLLGMGFDGADESDCIVTYKDARFVGGVFWTDFALYSGSNRLPTISKAMEVSGNELKDFYSISFNDEVFTPKISAKIHFETKAAVEKILKENFSGSTVGVSHHGLSPQSIDMRYRPGERNLNSVSILPHENNAWLTNPAFVSNCEDLISLADIWIHGHNHSSTDITIKGTRLIANPRGYCYNKNAREKEFENDSFNPDFVIDLELIKSLQVNKKMRI